jgi:hypothetical protein
VSGHSTYGRPSTAGTGATAAASRRGGHRPSDRQFEEVFFLFANLLKKFSFNFSLNIYLLKLGNN